MTERPNPGGQFSEPPKGLTPEARTRYTLWQLRYEAFKPAITAWHAKGGAYTGPHFDWMTPDNLGSYLLFRLDTIERAGGSNMEKILQREARANNAPYYISATSLLAMRLHEVQSEVSVWDDSSWQDYRHVHQHFSTPTFLTPADLTPRQNNLRETLQPRVDHYETVIQAGIDAEIHDLLDNG